MARDQPLPITREVMIKESVLWLWQASAHRLNCAAPELGLRLNPFPVSQWTLSPQRLAVAGAYGME